MGVVTRSSIDVLKERANQSLNLTATSYVYQNGPIKALQLTRQLSCQSAQIYSSICTAI